jgi:cytosine/uracil/thiamine/allantoin permease
VTRRRIREPGKRRESFVINCIATHWMGSRATNIAIKHFWPQRSTKTSKVGAIILCLMCFFVAKVPLWRP